ncbi:influenza virus NS1A-binding protein homolog A-like [Saccostrea cucullata]|uniref:influenza virus NS1A-binding protein homolog A-like n=1 Tax=Saccostrea cuccullata TaxID=36930 RepID=UPI002ED490C2
MEEESEATENTRAPLSYEKPGYEKDLLSSLCKLRKEKQLCDACLVVGAHDYPVHRAVLASASPFFLNMFETKEKEITFVLKDVEDHQSFEYLLDYTYTGRLDVPEESVKPVYRMATFLKLKDAATACCSFLAASLTSDNCLGIRKFAEDEELRKTIDDFIQRNIMAVTSNKKFYGLPQIPVEITGADQDLLESSNDKHMFELVLAWARENIDPKKPRIEDLTEQVNVLNLNTDNSLTDFKDVSDDVVKDQDGIVQDYKKSKKKMIATKTKEGTDMHISNSSVGQVRKFSINPSGPVSRKEWSIIATHQMKDKSYLALAMLNGVMAAISVHYRAPSARSGSTSPDEPDSPVTASVTPNKFFDSRSSLTPLAVMSTARCAFGLEVLDGQLVACGGYDRSECLRTSERFDSNNNKWIPLADMTVPRGRFNVASVRGFIYAVGGSDGFREQSALEYYDPEKKMWITHGEVRNAKVSQGLASLHEKLYCIGGCLGQKSSNECHVYDPKTNEWDTIAPLITARYQAAVCTFMGKIYVIGGTDAWICLNSVEIYDPEVKKWQLGPQLSIPRRGAGCDVFNGTIYLTGGSDGSQSLKSTEILTPDRGWVMGPSLSIPRANVGVVTCDKRLFAVGGFSGKKFLDSMEFLSDKHAEWCCYLPVENSIIAEKMAKRNSEGRLEKLDQNSNCEKTSTNIPCDASVNGH